MRQNPSPHVRQWTISCGPHGPRGRHRPGQAMQFEIDRLNASVRPDGRRLVSLETVPAGSRQQSAY